MSVEKSCQVETLKKIKIEIFIRQESEYGQFHTNFMSKNDINDDYVFTHKLKILMARLSKFAVRYFRQNKTIAQLLLPKLIKTEHENIYKFDTVYTTLPMQQDFLLDMAALISYICKKHQRFLIVSENYIKDKYCPQYNRLLYNFDLCDLKVISAEDREKLLETLNYTKIIPFNMSRCLRNNILLPKVIQYLAEQLSYDVAEEIASYVYVICIR